MTTQYYGIENLGLTQAQKTTLITALRQLGRNDSLRPNERNHWRARLDGEAVIFEGAFEDQGWTIQALKNRLGQIFGVDPATITHTTNQTQYGPVVTFARSGNKLRMVAFGGLLATWEQSHAAALAYIQANPAAWEPAAE